MSDDLATLYREQVLAHSRAPHRFGRLDDADVVVDGNNPLCGDALRVYVRFDDDALGDIRFEGHGCAISVASASMMTDMVHGADCGAARKTVEQVFALLTDEQQAPGDALAASPVAALAAVRRYPTRVKCATLAWQALGSALSDRPASVTTEEARS